MRSISIQEFEKDPKACIAEAEAGQRLILVRGGRAVVEINPGTGSTIEPETPQLWKTEEERLAAGAELMKIMRKGFNLGGLKVTDRDELYDRD
jgi:antitoxin (DNA-binding transcriptional repressor) of toxin-antitoxin stability system